MEPYMRGHWRSHIHRCSNDPTLHGGICDHKLRKKHVVRSEDLSHFHVLKAVRNAIVVEWVIHQMTDVKKKVTGAFVAEASPMLIPWLR
jgi:hypothetical protein